tara:strand:+ start:396 stop:1784 length:1389 start_codon:yes stop_codon:yes gene_type:complete
MTLIKSISGIRGTIGGVPEVNLTPLDIVRFTSAYGKWIKENNTGDIRIYTGRDSRISGSMVHSLVNNTLVGIGINVVDLGVSPTPTLGIAVNSEQASGGIMLSASHNKKKWNALKLFNSNGEFINAEDGLKILKYADNLNFNYANIDELGTIITHDDYIDNHINKILKLESVDEIGIQNSKFKIVVDGINSVGGVAIPKLLDALNVQVIKINCDPNGDFAHDPEPIAENLGELCDAVIVNNADLGIAVDPDVDRLVFVDEKGRLFSEEYTLVACADYILSQKKGRTVSNLSSTRALSDVTKRYGQSYFTSAVGELNVVREMKKVNAVIGGEGNGGVIYPKLHYGRDAMVGIALFLSLVTSRQKTVSEIRSSYPSYFMSKNKISANQNINLNEILNKLAKEYSNEKTSVIDGLKIDFPEMWVHLRKSNTEPVIRIYTEATTKSKAEILSNKFISKINLLLEKT